MFVEKQSLLILSDDYHQTRLLAVEKEEQETGRLAIANEVSIDVAT